jgi:hypothetical protein
MRMEYAAALDLFRKWLSDRSLIRCQGSLNMFSFSFKGRMVDVNPAEIRLMADDADSEFVLRITDKIEFGYADSRVVTGQEAADYECLLMVFLGPIPNEGEGESVAFAELKGSNSN